MPNLRVHGWEGTSMCSSHALALFHVTHSHITWKLMVRYQSSALYFEVPRAQRSLCAARSGHSNDAQPKINVSQRVPLIMELLDWSGGLIFALL